MRLGHCCFEKLSYHACASISMLGKPCNHLLHPVAILRGRPPFPALSLPQCQLGMQTFRLPRCPGIVSSCNMQSGPMGTGHPLSMGSLILLSICIMCGEQNVHWSMQFPPAKHSLARSPHLSLHTLTCSRAVH